MKNEGPGTEVPSPYWLASQKALSPEKHIPATPIFRGLSQRSRQTPRTTIPAEPGTKNPYWIVP